MMRPALLVCFLLLINDSLPYDCCKDQFCAPPLLKIKYLYVDNEILLPEVNNGCLCKEFPKKYVKCFGRTTCHQIPRNLNITVSELKLTTTNIKIIERYDLASYTNLTKLDIENHNNLELIEEYAFFTLNKLTNMSISFNSNLRYLKPKTFIGLTQLKELHLLKNGFNNIADISAALSPKYLPLLYDLVLKENDFSHVKVTDFEPMKNSSLGKLNLAQCRVNYIDPDSLNVFTKLEVLSVGVNTIDPENLTNLIEKLTEAKVQLKFLNLYKTGLNELSSTHLLKAIGNSTVECLSLAGNQFEVITENSFPFMENIKLLDLRDISAVNITEGAFDSVANLQTLLLGNNKFSSVPEGAIVQNLTYLDMSSFSKFYTYHSYFTVYSFTFSKMSKLQVLNLSFNTMQTLYSTTFFGLSKLSILSLKRCELFFIESGSFKPMKELIFLDLEKNHFATSKFKPLETDLFEGLEKLNVLLLGGNKINYINNLTFSSLKSLQHLSLDDNKLTHLDYINVIYLTNLKTLDLQKNHLSSWSTRLFESQRNLSTVYLGSNKITNLSWAMLEDIANLDAIDLSDNNFLCDCSLFGIYTNWLGNYDGNITKAFKESKALCFPTEKTLTDYLSGAEVSKICEAKIAEIITSVVGLFIFLAAVAFWVYYYRWHFRYYLFLTKLQLIRKGKKKVADEKAGHSNYEYDAFVSYSNEDSNFVIRLVSMLENYHPFLKLCVYERDFKIGSIISESILENVIKSRKVLLVISDNYVKSQWCQWETHIAQHCNLFFKNNNGDFVDDSLLLIRLGPVSQKHLTPTLKYLLKTRIYLQWNEDEEKQELFWKKLRENLARGKTESPVFTMTHL